MKLPAKYKSGWHNDSHRHFLAAKYGAASKVKLFHGSPIMNREQIAKEGLGGNRPVYLTPSAATAAWFANNNAATDDRGIDLYEVRVPIKSLVWDGPNVETVDRLKEPDELSQFWVRAQQDQYPRTGRATDIKRLSDSEKTKLLAKWDVRDSKNYVDDQAQEETNHRNVENAFGNWFSKKSSELPQ
jgi:hypothetical protein